MAAHEVWSKNRELAETLQRLTFRVSREPLLENADAIVAHIEVNDRHGVGVLIERLFGKQQKILSIRSKNFYEGRQTFGAKHVRISHERTSRDRVIQNVLRALDGATIHRIVCVPYFPDDVLTAIVLREIFNVPLCTYLMDDQNLAAAGIPDALLAELLEKSSLRLAISPELCSGYEQKYGHKMWFMPPLVPARSIAVKSNYESSGAPVIVGNIWGQRWVELLRATVGGSGIEIAWYNNGEFPWLPCSKEDLKRDGVIPREGRTSDDELIAILRQAKFVVVPSGVLDDTDDRRFIAQFSLPSRIPFIFATSHAPMLVLGNADTAAARFVTRSGIGVVAPYDRAAFLESVRRITDPVENRRMRDAAAALAPRYSDAGAAEWIWRSLARGEPADARFQQLLA